jgi:uncharacterized coiled-coil DUF342 family protein
MEIDKFNTLEDKINALIEQFVSLKKEKDEVEERLRQKEIDQQEILDRLEKLHKERDVVRSKLDGLIVKLDGISS